MTPEKVERLRRRGELLVRLRQFFVDRGFIEVETPLVSSEVIPEEHIEPMRVASGTYLQASPELHMKRLVATGMQAIYQVTRSFRADERGQLHHPEFTLVEWYRVGDDMQAGMTLLSDLCQALTDTPPAKRTTYAVAFAERLGLCPHTASCEELAQAADRAGIAIPEGMDRENRDEWLNLLLATRIEPALGEHAPEILHDYPASQASLAKITRRDEGVEVAERFELYWQGIELANGFHELTDAAELHQRLVLVNERRAAAGRPELPMPESLLEAMRHGLPQCSGCALGFDRLAMLALGASSISEVMACVDSVG